MSEIPARTKVVIVGGGPAGSLLAFLLHLQDVESVILERRSKEYVLGRIRAGVIEYGSGEILKQAGLGNRMEAEGFVHQGVNLAFSDRLERVDFSALTDKHVIIYGQTQLQKDLYDALDDAGIELVDEAENVAISEIVGTTPNVTFTRSGRPHSIDCDFVIGCDGAHGISRDVIPTKERRIFERLYPFVWVGILSETPPVNHELIYANHHDGFALCSMRNENLSRYYVQGDAEDTPEDWPDDKFWETLNARLPDEAASTLVTGPSIEKSVTPLRSWVSEPMRHGRLLLAGDVAHIVPPTGAKGLNLAISDVVYLAEALAMFYAGASETGLDEYAERALSRVWKAVRFSWWMTSTLHRFPGMSDDFDRRIQQTELEYLFSSESAQRAMAENYVGLPL